MKAPHSADLLDKLRAVDTPTICNALELIDAKFRVTGFTTKPLVCPFPDLPPMVGYARTATIRATMKNELEGKDAKAQRVAYYEYVAEGGPAPSVMLIQDLDGADV